MSVVANIAINVDSTKAVSQLQAVDRAATGLSGNTGKLQQAFGGLNTALAGLGLGVLIKDLAGAGIDADRTGKRIQNLAGSSGEAGRVFSIAAKAAKTFGLSNLEAEKGIGDLYGRLRPTGIGLKDIETVYNGVNKAALAAGLTNADTSGVFLQLSQALGSGALQGDELRSIMEQMPAVGQAVAKVMGVTVGEVKKLGADGLITTDIMIKAAAELNKLAPPPPDPFRQFEAAMGDLREELGENLLPILTPLIQGLLKLVQAFGALPEPVQTVIVGLGLFVTALLGIGTAWALLAPIFTALGTAFGALAALNVGGLIAGWLPVVASAASGIVAAFSGMLAWIGSTLIPGLLAFFSGPVGWTVLAVAAVVAMVVLFRKPLMDFAQWLWNWGEPIRKFWKDLFDGIVGIIQASLGKAKEILNSGINAIQETWKGISQFFTDNVITPINKSWQQLTKFLPEAMSAMGESVKSIFNNIGSAIKGVLNAILRGVFNTVNSAIDRINSLIIRANAISKKVNGPQLPTLGRLSVPQFAKGGIVRKPTLAMVGEGGEPEYIIPQSKMAGAVANYMKGLRGQSVIPAFAAGGYVGKIADTTNPLQELANQAFNKKLQIYQQQGQLLSVPLRSVNEPQQAMEPIAQAAEYLSQSAEYLQKTSETKNDIMQPPEINISTGPILQFDGKQYVTMQDFNTGLRQVADSIYTGLRKPSVRAALRI